MLPVKQELTNHGHFARLSMKVSSSGLALTALSISAAIKIVINVLILLYDSTLQQMIIKRILQTPKLRSGVRTPGSLQASHSLELEMKIIFVEYCHTMPHYARRGDTNNERQIFQWIYQDPSLMFNLPRSGLASVWLLFVWFVQVFKLACF